MKAYEFIILASGVDAEAAGFEDRLFEAGCDDATIAFQEGVIRLDFSREAASFSQAVEAACEDARRAGVVIERVVPER